MPGAKDLGKQFEAKYRKLRRLTETERAPDLPETPATKADTAITIRDNAERALGKAEELLGKASAIAILRSVPVSEEARDVRAAVRRKREATGGRVITLDLYLEALDYLEQEQDAINQDVLAVLPGDPATAGRALEISRSRHADNLSYRDAAYMASQAFTLVMQKLLAKGLDNLDAQGQTAPKQPASAEIPSVLLGIAISQIVSLLVTNLLQDEYEEDIADQPGGAAISAADVDSKLGEARGMLENMRAYKLAQVYQNPSDYRLIVDYVGAYLAEVAEPGWEEWQLIPDIKSTQSELTAVAQSISLTIPAYEQEDTTPTEAKTDPLGGFLTGPDSPLANVKSSVENSFYGGMKAQAPNAQSPLSSKTFNPPQKLLGILESQVGAANTFIDRAAAVLGWKETKDALCCLVRILGGIDTSMLQSLRKILNTTISGLSVDLNFVATGSMNMSWTLGKRATTQMLWKLMDGYDNFVEGLWEYAANDETAQQIAACTPFDEILMYVSNWARHYLDMAVQFALKYTDVLVVRHRTSFSKLSSIGNAKKIRRYLAVIDMVLAAVDRGTLCNPSQTQSPEASDVSDIARQIEERLPQTISVPTGEQEDPYADFTLAQPLEFANGIRMSESIGDDTPDDTDTKLDHGECRKRLSGNDLKQFDTFVRTLNVRMGKYSPGFFS